MRSARLVKADGTLICDHCELALNPWTRLRGLLGRDGLADGEGMLFRPAGSIHTMFMRFPIDVIFCDRDLTVIRVERGLAPWRTAGARRTKVVVELRAGGADGIEPGDELALDEPAGRSGG